jgi:hypothetical protein
VRRRIASTVAVAVLVLGGCSPGTRSVELDADGRGEAELVDGLVVVVDAFEPGRDADGAPTVRFDVTLTNRTGDTFDPRGVGVSAFQGGEGGQSGIAVVEVETDEGPGFFDATIPHGESVTVTHEFEAEAGQVVVMVRPEGDEGAHLVFAGDVPS